MALFANLLDAPRRRGRNRRVVGEHAEPASAHVMGSALVDRTVVTAAAAGAVWGIARHPVRTAAVALAATRGAVAYVAALRPTTPTSLTGRLGAARRYRFVAVDRADITLMRERLGGSPNDAALAIVTRAFRHLLVTRGEHPSAHAVRCLVPVSTRDPADASHANRVSAMLVELPVDFADAGSAYGATAARMRQVKLSHEVDAGELAVTLAGYLPPPAASRALHAAFRIPQRMLTTVVTNVPGPPDSAAMLGRHLLALYPYVPIADRIRIGVAVCTFGDHLYFGVTCDRDSVRDAEVFAGGIRDGAAELAKAAAALGGASS
jgi:diacylglycerol O-acyltransferase